jgi:hypothetical protein
VNTGKGVREGLLILGVLNVMYLALLPVLYEIVPMCLKAKRLMALDVLLVVNVQTMVINMHFVV